MVVHLQHTPTTRSRRTEQKERTDYKRFNRVLNVRRKMRKISHSSYSINMVLLHVTRRAVMAPVWLDNLTAVTVTDCCINTAGMLLLDSSTTAVQTHAFTFGHTCKTYLRLLCGCTEVDWWQLSIGSPAGTLASPPSRNALSQLWVGRTGVGENKNDSKATTVLTGYSNAANVGFGFVESSQGTSLEGLSGLVKMVFQ